MTSDKNGAVISECGRYRYRLWRCWNANASRCCFIMLNPSTADAAQDDPTIRKCVKFAKRWGFGGIEIVNLFALRATDPIFLRSDTRPIGPDNDAHIRAAASGANIGRVVCAWGANGLLLDRGKAVLGDLFEHDCVPLYAFKFNKDGTPAHPLYQRDDTELVMFTADQLFEARYT